MFSKAGFDSVARVSWVGALALVAGVLTGCIVSVGNFDESERIDLVIDYHRSARIAVPNPSIHASLHVIVENQIIMGDETPVAATLGRLMAEGLDRHDAIHAIASVLSDVMYDTMKPNPNGDLNAAYFREVAALTTARWRSQAE
jgi:hypothetical protein